MIFGLRCNDCKHISTAKMKLRETKARTERRASFAPPASSSSSKPPKRPYITPSEVYVRPKRLRLWINAPVAKMRSPSPICSDQSDSISDSLNGIGELGDIFNALGEADDAEKMAFLTPENWKRHVLSLFLEVFM